MLLIPPAGSTARLAERSDSPVPSCFGRVSYHFIPLFTSTPLGPLPTSLSFLFSCPVLLLSFRCVLRVALHN
jgi:hypothetical protein